MALDILNQLTYLSKDISQDLLSTYMCQTLNYENNDIYTLASKHY